MFFCFLSNIKYRVQSQLLGEMVDVFCAQRFNAEQAYMNKFQSLRYVVFLLVNNRP